MIVAAGILLLIQGIAQVCRCIVCMRTGTWPRQIEDVEETEKLLLAEKAEAAAQPGSTASELLGQVPNVDVTSSQGGDKND